MTRPNRSKLVSEPRNNSQSTEKADHWALHEHVAPPVQAQAEQLLKEAGSPGLARQALDAAQGQQVAAGSPQDEFARRWGFASYLELFETSTLVRSAAGKNWRLAVVPKGGWIAWNETDFQADRSYPTREEAVAGVPSQEEA